MIKYAKSDIEDGISSAKIGVGNIIGSIARGEISMYTLELPIDYLIAVSLVRKLYPEENIQYSNNAIHVKVASKSISIEFLNDRTVFHI